MRILSKWYGQTEWRRVREGGWKREFPLVRVYQFDRPFHFSLSVDYCHFWSEFSILLSFFLTLHIFIAPVYSLFPPSLPSSSVYHSVQISYHSLWSLVLSFYFTSINPLFEFLLSISCIEPSFPSLPISSVSPFRVPLSSFPLYFSCRMSVNDESANRIPYLFSITSFNIFCEIVFSALFSSLIKVVIHSPYSSSHILFSLINLIHSNLSFYSPDGLIPSFFSHFLFSVSQCPFPSPFLPLTSQLDFPFSV